VSGVAATVVWFFWLREPSRELPPEFIRHVTCENAKLVKVLLAANDLIVVGDAEGRVFEAQFEEQSKKLPPKGDAATTMLALSNDGLLLAGDDSGLLRSWQLPAGQFKSIDSPKVPVTCAAFLSTGGRQAIFLGLSDGRLLMVDDSGSRVFKTTHRGIKAMALSPDQKKLVICGTAGLVSFFDTTNVELTQTVKHHRAEVAGVAWSADGESIVTGDWDGRLALISAKSHKVTATGEQPDAVCKLVLLGDHFITGSWDGQIRKWSISKKSLSITGQIDTGRAIHDLAINTAGDTVITVSGSDRIEFWKTP
jgi:WD40 repeat protein